MAATWRSRLARDATPGAAVIERVARQLRVIPRNYLIDADRERDTGDFEPFEVLVARWRRCTTSPLPHHLTEGYRSACSKRFAGRNPFFTGKFARISGRPLSGREGVNASVSPGGRDAARTRSARAASIRSS